MVKITLLVLGLITFFLQGYFLRDALFKLIPSISESLRSKTEGHESGPGKRFLVRAATIIIAGVILVLVLPGFLQAGVILILDINRENLRMAVGSVVGWLFGILARGLMIQIQKSKRGNEEETPY